jgi:hypothetical protein
MVLQHFSIKTIIFALNDYVYSSRINLDLQIVQRGSLIPTGFPAIKFITRSKNTH